MGRAGGRLVRAKTHEYPNIEVLQPFVYPIYISHFYPFSCYLSSLKESLSVANGNFFYNNFYEKNGRSVGMEKHAAPAR
jgi:hypothetical protein